MLWIARPSAHEESLGAKNSGDKHPPVVPVLVAIFLLSGTIIVRSLMPACDRALARMSRQSAKGVSVHARRALSIARSLFRCSNAVG